VVEGCVTAERKAVVSVSLEGPSGQHCRANAVVDTGLTGYLALSAEQVSELGLRFLGARIGTLADGRPAVLNAFQATVDWLGEQRIVPVLEVQGTALLGMALLHGSRMTMGIVENGPLQIEPLG